MATQMAHVWRNLNLGRVQRYVPPYAAFALRPTVVRTGPMLWCKMLPLFDIFHDPKTTVKYIAFDPDSPTSSFEILVNHSRQELTLGSYNHYDFRLHLFFHMIIDVYPFFKWGRCMFEHASIDGVVRRAFEAKPATPCRPFVGSMATILDEACVPVVRQALRGER